jgi:isocitrate/isopropylmalate dehydrogenase
MKLVEALQAQGNEKENFDLQLQLLEQRGKLQKSEIKKIGDLNAELFGHSNTRQKIKHVAQLKEENMTLREVFYSFNLAKLESF